MTRRAIDLQGVRRELRALTRGNLLIIAERTAELISNAKLKALMADFFAINEIERHRWPRHPSSTKCIRFMQRA